MQSPSKRKYTINMPKLHITQNTKKLQSQSTMSESKQEKTHSKSKPSKTSYISIFNMSAELKELQARVKQLLKMNQETWERIKKKV